MGVSSQSSTSRRALACRPPLVLGPPGYRGNVTPLRVRCAALDTAQGIDTLCRERVRLPAPPAVLGPEHLPPTRRTVDALGRLRTGGDNHEGAVDADVVVKAHPRRPQIGATI